MRFVSPVTLGLVLGLTTMSLGVSVPVATAKEKAAEAPKLKLSDAFKAPIIKTEQALAKKDTAAAAAAIAEAEPLAKTPDELYMLNSERLNLSILTKDTALQQRALTGLLDTGLVPQAQVGQFNMFAAQGDLTAKKYDSALARAQAALAAGYKADEANLTIAQAYFGKAEGGNPAVEPGRTAIVNGLKAFRLAIDASKAAGQAVPAQWYAVGVSRADAANLPEIKDWAQMAYEAEPNGVNLRTLLRVYQRANPAITNRENLDVMRLMSASGGLAVKGDFAEYAEMAFKGGVLGETKSAIDKGRAGGKMTSTDSADLYALASQKVAGDKASLPASEVDARKSATGKIASAAADAYLGYGDYAKAVTFYQLAISKGGADIAEANTRLGIALALSGDTEGAKAAFSKVTTGTRGDIARYWLTWLAHKTAA
ncbi:MAG: hypothetical protein ABI395_01345 [Sphingobium sp.]